MSPEHAKIPNGIDSEVVSVDEVQTRLRGEWVLMRVTRFDETRDPTHGIVIAHSVDRDEISRALPPRPAPPAPSDGPYYVFFAEPRIRSGPQLDRAAIEELNKYKALREARRRGLA
jgi:hypothetical protein